MPSRDRRAGVRGRTGAGDGNPWMAGAVGGIDGQLLVVASLNADPSRRRPAPRRRLEDPAVGVGLVVDLVDAVRDAGDLDELRGQVPGVDVAPALADAHVLPDPIERRCGRRQARGLAPDVVGDRVAGGPVGGRSVSKVVDILEAEAELLGGADDGGIGHACRQDSVQSVQGHVLVVEMLVLDVVDAGADRKSTRLNSSHQIISYAVFCLKKKKTSYYLCTM